MTKVALITGASSEIGAAIAMQLAAQYDRLYLHFFENRKKVEYLKKQCETQWNVEVVLIQADLSKPQGVADILALISLSPQLIIHCSGNSYVGLLTEMPDNHIQAMVQLHLTSAIQLTKALLPPMIQQKEGRVIIVSSIWGLAGASCEVVYSAVKGGLNSFVKALAKEVAPSNIYVNGVAPGAIDTRMLHTFSPDEMDMLADEIPLGRLGKPEEVANVVQFLSSPQSSYISGQIISINGAWYC